MTQRTNRIPFFDAAFFKFTFATLLKKTSIYIAIIAYFLLILIFTVITPLLSNSNPITIISNPIMALFLVFSMAVIGCFISIEIFRTSIDDGTELLVVSKPLSRTEIIFVKCLVFIICILTISLLGAILSTTSFISTNSYYMDNINIVFGVFVGSLVCGLIFGSLSTILSIYLRKIVSMLLTIAIAFLLMVYSLLSTFVVNNPVKILGDEQDSILPISVINYNNNDNQDTGNMSLVQGVIPQIGSGNSDKSAETIWNDAKNRSNYQIAGTFDIGAQLGSIFSLTTPPKDSLQALSNLSVFNSPIDITFSNYDLLNDNSQIGLFLRFPHIFIDVDSITSIVDPMDKLTLKNVLDKYNSTNRKITKFIGVKNESSSIRVANSRLWGSSIDYSYGDFITTENNPKVWENAWSKQIVVKENSNSVTTTISDVVNKRIVEERQKYYDAKQWKLDPNNTSYYPSWIPNYLTTNSEKDAYVTYWSNKNNLTSPARIFLEEYAKAYNLSQFNVNSFVREINSLVFSAFYKYTKLSVYDPNNIENEMDVLNIIDLLNDIDNDVIVDDIFPGFDIIDPTTDRELFLLKEALKQLYSEYTNGTQELKGSTKFSEIQDMIRNNDNLRKYFEQKSQTKNEYRTIFELLGISFPQILDKQQVNIKKYLVKDPDLPGNSNLGVNLDKFQDLVQSTDRIKFTYYVGDNPNGGNLATNLDEYDLWDKDNWVFSFYSSVNILPVSFVSGFNQIYAFNLINRNILIPVWIGLSVIMFIIGMTLYSKRDFA